MKKLFTLCLLASSYVLAQEITLKDTSSSLDITIYNNNLGFVKQNKSFKIPQKGYHNLSYEGVPHSIVIDSVIPTFSQNTTTLYSQNFEQNDVNYKSILEYYKKNNLNVNYYEPTLNTTKKKIARGKIISKVQNIMTLQNNKGKIQSIAISDIYFDSLPLALQRTKPSLSWRVFSNSGKQDVALKYLMNNISWNANYTLDLNKPNANLKGWITINNNTGIAFENANIYCLAGQVNKVTPVSNPRVMKKMMVRAEAMMDAAPIAVKEQSMSGYHLYTIPFKETITKGSKQINFIQKPEVHYEQIASINTSMPTYQLSREKKLSFDHVVQIKNTKANGLGLALPKGIVRVFSKDDEGKTHFIGENRIKHTANKEDIKIKIGKFFDIKASVKQIKFKSTNTTFDRYLLSKIETKVSNQDKVVRTIHIDQTHSGYGKYELHSSCSGLCQEEKLSATRTRYVLNLKPKEEYVFTTTYELD
ncbi:MAG: hypothetical protein U9N30_02250 [Campylobacterota bacterium]|nr:hypothetical protein [Campylobacterota bacterium]